MDDDFELDTESLALSRRFRKADLTVLALDLVAGVAEAISGTLMIARNCAAMHANWKADQDLFHDEATLEIESLTTGDED